MAAIYIQGLITQILLTLRNIWHQIYQKLAHFTLK